MQPLSGNQRPDLRTSLMNMSFVPPLPRRVHLCRTSSNVPRLPTFFKLLQNPHVLLTFDKVHNPWRLPRETTSERPKALATWNTFLLFHLQMCLAPQRRTLFRHLNLKMVRGWGALYILIHFDLDVCFARQRHALFRHHNFKKGSKVEVLCAFSLGNVLLATTACTFSTAQHPKVLWTRQFLVLLATTACNLSSLIWPAGSAPAALASLLFDPPEPQIIGKTQCFATFLPFPAPGFSFFWDVLFFDLLSFSLLFSDSSHPCFSSVHIVGSLTSKLPSIIIGN